MKSVHGKARKTPSEKVNTKASSKNAGRREDGLGDMSSGEDSNMDNAGSENEVNGYKLNAKVNSGHKFCSFVSDLGMYTK